MSHLRRGVAGEAEGVAVGERDDGGAEEDEEEPQPERLGEAAHHGGVPVEGEDQHGNGGDHGVDQQVPGVGGQPVGVDARAAYQLQRRGVERGVRVV
jgi:hypothetical protein